MFISLKLDGPICQSKTRITRHSNLPSPTTGCEAIPSKDLPCLNTHHRDTKTRATKNQSRPPVHFEAFLERCSGSLRAGFRTKGLWLRRHSRRVCPIQFCRTKESTGNRMIEASTSFLFTIDSGNEGLTCRSDPIDDSFFHSFCIFGSGRAYTSLHLANENSLHGVSFDGIESQTTPATSSQSPSLMRSSSPGTISSNVVNKV